MFACLWCKTVHSVHLLHVSLPSVDNSLYTVRDSIRQAEVINTYINKRPFISAFFSPKLAIYFSQHCGNDISLILHFLHNCLRGNSLADYTRRYANPVCYIFKQMTFTVHLLVSTHH